MSKLSIKNAAYDILKSTLVVHLKLAAFPIYPLKLTRGFLKDRHYGRALFAGISTLSISAIWAVGYLVLAVSVQAIAGNSKVIPDSRKVQAPTQARQLNEFTLFKLINSYRQESDLSRVSLDTESCTIAERIVHNDWWQKDYYVEDFRDLCPSCSSLTVVLGTNYSSETSVIEAWRQDVDTNENIISKADFGCVRINNTRIALVLTNKSDISGPAAKNSTTNGPPTDLIDCTGPDGNSFKTSQQQCEDFNSAWGSSNTSSKSVPPPKSGPQQPSSGLSYHCYDNTYDYWYYTSSGEQCNISNSNNYVYESCHDSVPVVGEYADCTGRCNSNSSSDYDLCTAAYSGSGALIENNMDLYFQCSNEVSASYSTCLEACGPLYNVAFDKCVGK